MLRWALRFFTAAILTLVLMRGDIGDSAAFFLTIVAGLLLALSGVSVIAALRRPLR
jgi:uncharacterized membrane protein YtjA (UPF0391 family)